MSTPTALICPKCKGQMRSYERSGIVVDQCEECRGIFLDRGELERLIDAESGSSAGGRERGHERESDKRPGQRKSRTSTLLELFGGE